MTVDQLLEVLKILIPAIIGSGLTYLAMHRNTKRQERADVMAAYSQLCDDYRAAIALNNAETARLRQELADLKCLFKQDREAWQREREALLARIAELEAQNKHLEARLAVLQARANGKECHGS